MRLGQEFSKGQVMVKTHNLLPIMKTQDMVAVYNLLENAQVATYTQQYTQQYARDAPNWVAWVKLIENMADIFPKNR